MTIGGIGALAAVAAAPVAMPALVGAFWAAGGIFSSGLMNAGVQVPYQAVRHYVTKDRVVARITIPRADLPGAVHDAPICTVRARHLRESTLLPLEANDDVHAPRLMLAHEGGKSELHGAAASRVRGVLLAQVNQWGASAGQVRAAVHTIEERGDAAGWLRVAARRSSRPYGRVMAEWRRVGAFSLTPVERLAVEMALHEAQERAVLEGELGHLALAWEHAESIAAIADSL
jgi:hypothetical protein